MNMKISLYTKEETIQEVINDGIIINAVKDALRRLL